ncbi:MAG: D-alanyl-D-alanine carboxypeptidase [Chroococcales cyanobacterium]
MKKVRYWRLPVITFALVAIANSLIPKQAIATTPAANLSPQAIEIPVPPPENKVSPGVCQAFLEPTLDNILSRPNLRGGQWGIQVESLNGTVFYSRNADKALVPASNIKLLTTAAALLLKQPQSPLNSTSLENWIRITNLRSNNQYADTLLRSLGGATTVKTALAPLGVNSYSFRQVDGSGLSRQNRATPRTLTTLLRGMYGSNNWNVFYSSLPVAGESGTLRNRFHASPVQGRVRAKTGTLRGVRALSGYLDHPEYGILIFSILANAPQQSGQVLVSTIDEIVLRLAQLDSCS